MITNGKKYYIALKSEPADDRFNRPIRSLFRLFREVTWNHDGDFYCLNCLHSFDYCTAEKPTKFNKILKYNHGEKSLRAPFVIYAELECLLLK